MSVTAAFIPMHPSSPQSILCKAARWRGGIGAAGQRAHVLSHNLSVPKANSSALIRLTRTGMKIIPLGTYLLLPGEGESREGSHLYEKEKW